MYSYNCKHAECKQTSRWIWDKKKIQQAARKAEMYQLRQTSYFKLRRIALSISIARTPVSICHIGQLCLGQLKITGKLIRFEII